jgi:CRISPR/Cas system-associated protein Csx1
MAAVPPATLLGMDQLKKGIRYSIIHNNKSIGSGIFDRRQAVFGGGVPNGIFHSMEEPYGRIGSPGANPGERSISAYYYSYLPTAYGGRRLKRKTKKSKKYSRRRKYHRS